MPTGPAFVEGRDVRIEYAGFCAVEEARFDVCRGEKFVIIGPSGCGKTTLLKAIAGFLQPSSGTILVDGRPVGPPGPDRAVVFQDFEQLFAWKSVRENVIYALGVAKGIRGVEARARADRMLELVGITYAAEKYPHQLSGGMKQRAAIARALALEPSMLLMDEPFGALDAITRSELQIELNEIWKKTGVTIVLITHSIQEAVFLGHRVMVMSKAPAVVRAVVDASEADEVGSERFSELSTQLRSLLISHERAPAAVTAGASE